MSWLESVDLNLFRFINLKLSHPVLDAVMPQFSGNAWFIPAAIVLAIGLLWKGGQRGRLFILMLAIILPLGDGLVINKIKHAVSRERPFQAAPDAHLLVGKGSSGSMPSSHTSTWAAATLIAWVFYRRSWKFMLPLAATMAFSRVYLGVHYPSDVIAGAILGAGYAAAGLWGLNNLWRWIGQQWFPIWWNRRPSLVEVSGLGFGVSGGSERPQGATKVSSFEFGVSGSEAEPVRNPPSLLADLQWLRLGYVVLAVLLVARLLYLASGKIELSEDEAYQWLWSKHLALSYFSKPPMIALLQFLGTTLWGDTAFGVRFFSPVISAALGVMILHFFSRQVSVRAGFFLLLILNCTPLLSAGSVLMTIDPPLVLFWTAAMVAGWRAVQASGTTRDWLWVGLWAGLSFLSKYSATFLAGCFALFFLLWPAARVHLRRPGPWLALLLFGLCTIPVIVWNWQNGWITVHHLSDNAKLDKPWQPTLRHFADFTGQELGLLNPVFLVGILIAVFSFWKRAKQTPLLLYFFAMGAPVFFGYWLYTLHSRVQGNWIAPAVVPLLGLMVVYWEQRWREGLRVVKGWLIAGLAIGAIAVVLFHDTDLTYKVARVRLPVPIDPLRRVRAISKLAETTGQARSELAAEGKETFIIASHYGLTGQLTFYLPEARQGLPGSPLVYVRAAKVPRNQFYFWPEYRYAEHRKGQNAIYVTFNDTPEKAPSALAAEFESVTDLGIREIKYGKRVFHRVQLFACRNLR